MGWKTKETAGNNSRTLSWMPPLCRSCISISSLNPPGVGGLDFIFLHFTDEETETKRYELTYPSVSC